MHTIWQGSITFGLVTIPVNLHAATEDKSVSLRNVHKECKQPIKNKKICPNCNKEVTDDDIVKAYEYANNKYVLLDEDELKELKDEHNEKNVEVLEFVKLSEIDPIYFNNSYYLSPSDGGGRAYSLFRQAISKNKKIAVAKVTIRSKENLAVIRVYKNSLVM